MDKNVLDEQKIKMYCEKYGYSCNCFGDNVVITTPIDEWRLEAIEVYNRYSKEYTQKIKVQHINKAGNKSRKFQFHLQRRRLADDIDYVFNNIIATHKNPLLQYA